MKKLLSFLPLMAMLLTSCGSKSLKSDAISLSEDIEQEFVTFAEVDSIMSDLFNNCWSFNIDKVKVPFDAKGYELIEDEQIVGRDYFMKNCKLKQEGEFGMNISFTKANPDSLASAVCFIDYGGSGIFADFYLFEDEVYDLIIEQAKTCGFKVATAEEKQKYEGYAEVKPETDFIYKGNAYLVLDKANHKISLRYIPFLPKDFFAEAKPGISEKLTCENYLNLLDFIDDESYAKKCGFKKVYKDVNDQGDVEFVYGYDVEKNGRGNHPVGYGFNLKATSDHACYVMCRYFSFGSLDASLYFKDRQDAENFFNSAKRVFDYVDGGYSLAGKKIPRNNKRNNFEIEGLYMSNKILSSEGWFVVDIDTGDYGD